MKKLLKSFVSVFLTAVIAVTGVCQCFGFTMHFYCVTDGGDVSYKIANGVTTVTSADKEIKAFDGSISLHSYLIGTMAFYNCKNLKYVDLGSLCIDVKGYAFENCTELEKVFVWDDCNINEYAFLGCNKNKLVFYCKAGSNVEEFAKNNGFKYITFTEDTLRYGDVNFDGVINAEDAALVMQYVLGSINESDKYMIEYNFAYGNVNRDNNINSADAAEILQKTLDSGYLMPCDLK